MPTQTPRESGAAFRNARMLLWCVAMLLGCWGPSDEPPVGEPSGAPALRIDPVALVTEIPDDASAESLREPLETLLSQISLAGSREMPRVYESIRLLRDQPKVVEALIELYHGLEGDLPEERLLAIGLLGQLQRVEAFDFLSEIASEELPTMADAGGEGPWLDEVALRVKAVHGIAYLRSEPARTKILSLVSQPHDAPIRFAAIDAYLWNQGDTPEARSEIYSRVRPEDRRFVGLARREGGGDSEAFQRALASWRTTNAEKQP